MKRLIAVILLLLMMLLVLSSCGISDRQEKEPNDTTGTANVLELDGYVEGAIRTSDADNDDVDWFSFTLSAMSEIELYLSLSEGMTPSDTVWGIALYDSDGNTEINNHVMIGNEDTTVKFGSLPEGTYYIQMIASHRYKQFIPYTLFLEMKHECHGELIVLTEPTCTEDGEEAMACTTCGALMESHPISAKGHTCSDWVVDVEANCIREGSRHGSCSACNQSVTEKIDKSGHSLSDWRVISGSIIIPPIVKERACEVCDYAENVKDWGYAWVTVLAAIAAVGLCIGVVAYIKAYRNP